VTLAGKAGSTALVAALVRVRLVVFDFDGVFTDNTVYVSQDGTESVRCWRGDGLGLRRLDRVGISYLILSTETNAVVSARAVKLKSRCIHSVVDKLAELRRVCSEVGVALDEVAFVGNDINDLACLRAVGLPVAVADAHPDVLDAVVYVTQTAGGRGAVREVCDLLASALANEKPA
jgi:3-deoxy-D-manno-octulosonate 8-phosphate phosphatase (KDO 8-P phosphatase)